MTFQTLRCERADGIATITFDEPGSPVNTMCAAWQADIAAAVAQIDTPYLTEGSSGMTFAVDRFKGWGHGGHVTLARGERSRLADFASEVL